MSEVSAGVDSQFWGLVDVRAKGECWPWKGCAMPPKRTAISGYGYYYIGGVRAPAHRYSFVLVNGEINPDLVVDHLCRNPCCVNPSHLEAVSNVENVMRGLSPPAQNARKEFCKRGHHLGGENLWLHNGKRHCRECRRQALRQVRARKKSARAALGSDRDG